MLMVNTKGYFSQYILLTACFHFLPSIPLPENVLKSTLSLYKHDTTLPMPTYEEVLLCNEQTTDEEVTLLWKRALGDPNHFRIFCLVHAEKLSYQTCDKALRNLQELSQGEKGKR